VGTSILTCKFTAVGRGAVLEQIVRALDPVYMAFQLIFMTGNMKFADRKPLN